MALSVLGALAQSLLFLPVASIIGRTFDHDIPGGHAGDAALASLLLLALYAASTGLGLLTRYIGLRVTTDAVARLRVELIEHLYRLPRAALDGASVTELQSMVVQDSERVDFMSNGITGVLLPAALIGLGLSAVAVVQSPLLFGTVIAVVPVLLIVNRVVARDIRARTRHWQVAFDAFASRIALGLRAMPLTKIHAAERFEVARHTAVTRELGAARFAMSWASGAYATVQGTVSAGASVAVLAVGGWSVARGHMSMGTLLGFYAILVLLLRQITAIVANVPIVMSGYESVARLDRLLRANAGEPYRGTRVIDFRGGLALERVAFSYGEVPVLRDVDLALAPGERVAIVGPNGAGKTTLVNLVLGLYRPQRGRLLAEGVPFDDLDIKALRRRMGAVLQDPIIFPGTVAENIAYGCGSADLGEIRRAATGATAGEFVDDLPDGLATQVGDEGVRLSGGQRQRIALARALMSSPALLILDEPTTYLDDAASARLMENLSRLPGNPSVIVISHDPKVEAWADRVIHLRDGTTGQRATSTSAVLAPKP
jgi:ATP-binding cassette subfamily B protein